jgi:hypothetical protein
MCKICEVKMKALGIIAFIICSTLVALAQTSNQIIYRDFEPDTCATSPRNPITLPVETKDTISVDIDEDNINDLMIHYAGPRPDLQSRYIRTQHSYAYICNASINDTLSSNSLHWYFGGSPLGMEQTFGYKLSIDENNYYGWFSISTTYNETDKYFCIDKMAFCTIPNYPLLWGQTEIENSVPQTESDGAMLYLDYINGESKLGLSSESEILAVEITSANGQLLKKQSVKNANQTEIDVSNLPAGVYVVKATLIDKRVVCAKFVK